MRTLHPVKAVQRLNTGSAGVPPAKPWAKQGLKSCPQNDAGETPALPVFNYRTVSVPLIFSLSLLVFFAVPWLTYSGTQIKRGQTVYIVAVRDSHLLTMCPMAGEVKLASGLTWKSDNKVLVGPPASNRLFTFLDGPHVSLPLSAPNPPGAQSDGAEALGKTVLDRPAPDAELERRIEREFLDLKDYPLVYTLDKAGLVFLVEGIYSPEELWVPQAPGSGKGFFVTNLNGDRRATFLQAALAIVVPGDVYRRNPADIATLLAARLWEGSVVWQKFHVDTRTPASKLSASKIREAASPAALVRQFLGKEKRPPSHFPLCAASGQPLPGPDAAPESSRTESSAGERKSVPVIPAQVPQDAGATIKVDVALVTIPVIATDSDGKAVPNLQASDFHLFEDNVEQKIDRLITAGDPFDVALMLDTSDSMNLSVQDLQRAALSFVEALRPEDRIIVASFNDRIYLHSESIADRSRLRPAILQVGRGQGTRLYDALDLVMTSRLNDLPGRKAIVLFTDGVDTRSLLVDEVRSLASVEGSQIPVYVIQYDTEAQSQSRIDAFSRMPRQHGSQPLVLPEEVTRNHELYARAAHYLQGLSHISGGLLYPVQTLDKLKETFTQIAWELGRQYTLCYYPANPRRDGSLRTIRITTSRQDVKLRFRTAYRSAK